MRIFLISLCLLVAAGCGRQRGDKDFEYFIPDLEDSDIKHDYQQNLLYVRAQFEILRNADKEPATEVEETWIRVYENGKQVQQVKLIRKPAERGLNIVMVLDISGSMKAKASDKDNKSKIEALYESASAFVHRLPRGTRVTLLPFSDTVRTPKPFTENKAELEKAIRELKPGGGTLLFDAIENGIETLMADRHRGKKAVIVLTDGKDEDPGSRHAPSDVIDLAKEAKVPLYLLGLGKKRDRATQYPGDIDEDVMERLARETNGTYHQAENQDQLLKLFGDLANQYQEDDHFVIEFASLLQKQDGTARSIGIEIWRDGKRVSNAAKGKDVVRGVVLPELEPWVYLPLLVLLTGLLLLPYSLSRLSKSAPAKAS